MPTLEDTIDLTDTVISFSLDSTPLDGNGHVASGRPNFATTDENGDFSIELRAGYHIVRIPHTPAFRIRLPAGDATYGFSETITTTQTGEEGTMTAILGASALRAQTSHDSNQIVFLDYLNTAGDGQGGWFVYSVTSAVADDGVDYIQPEDVTGAGRWVRTQNP